MKNFLPFLLVFTMLLVGCESAEGFLDVPASPSAEFSERFETSSASSSEEASSEESAVQATNRKMAFHETETEGIFRIQTRIGDLDIIDMCYSSGRFAAITEREAGIALTGYDDEGNGVYAGILDEEFENSPLLGFADGFACLYSFETHESFACSASGSYYRAERSPAEEVHLYANGFVFIADGVASLCAPDQDVPYTTYTLPSSAEWLAGNEERALIRKDGRLSVLYPDGNQGNTLSELLSYAGGALVIRTGEQTLFANPVAKSVAVSADSSEVLAAGEDFLVKKTADGIRFSLSESQTAYTLQANDSFRFGGRTPDGFLYGLDHEWFLLSEEVFTADSTQILGYEEETDLLFTAGQVLCALSEQSWLILSEDGAPFALPPEVAGFTAHRVTDGEMLLNAAALLLGEIGRLESSPQNVCLYLCARVETGGNRTDYLFFEDGTTVGVLLDVSDPEKLPALFAEISDTIQEENTQ